MDKGYSHIDVSIENAWILTLDSELTEYQNGCIQISNGKIIYVGPQHHSMNYKIDQKIDAKGMIIIPPFFNSHSHAPMSLLRGMGNDVPLQEWLENYIWPAEAKGINPESVYLGALLSGIESLRSGCNIFADMYFFEDEVAQAAIKLGMRAIIGEAILDFATPNMKTADDGIAYSKYLHQKYHDHELISLSIAAHSPYACSEENLKKVISFSQDYKVPATIHLSETEQEVNDSYLRLGKSPVKYLHSIGFFDYHTVCYHCNHLSDDDRKILKDRNISVVTLPNSNCKLASGIAPVVELHRDGINVAIGTDGAASNNNTSMLNDLQLMIKLQKVRHLDPTVLSAPEALRMATFNGAKAYRKETQLGSLEVGKMADLLFIDARSPNMVPLYNPYAQIVYSMHNKDVHSMMINGKFVLRDRKINGIDEEEILERVKELRIKLNID